jgi:hypothetical protein
MAGPRNLVPELVPISAHSTASGGTEAGPKTSLPSSDGPRVADLQNRLNRCSPSVGRFDSYATPSRKLLRRRRFFQQSVDRHGNGVRSWYWIWHRFRPTGRRNRCGAPSQIPQRSSLTSSVHPVRRWKPATARRQPEDRPDPCRAQKLGASVDGVRASARLACVSAATATASEACTASGCGWRHTHAVARLCHLRIPLARV